MAITYFPEIFTLDAGASMPIGVWFNGDGDNGGDYVGPVAAAAAPMELGQAVTVSTNRLVFTAQDPGGLSSKCFYWYTFTNEGSDPVTFRVHSFHE